MDDKLTATLKGQVDKPFPSSRNIWVVLLLVLMVPLIIGCAGRYGHLQRDAGVTSMFATNNVPQTYRYYADGRSGMPYAIIGIDPNVPFEMHYWESVDANTETFAQKVRFIWRPNGRAGHPQGQGAYILGPEGNRIGIWYSMYVHTTIVVHGDGQTETLAKIRDTVEIHVQMEPKVPFMDGHKLIADRIPSISLPESDTGPSHRVR